MEHTVAAGRARVIGAWEDLWVDPRGRLHLDLHLRAPPAPGGQLMLARLAGLAVVDVLVARSPHHAGSFALLVVLAVLANVGALISTLGRPQSAGVQAGALALMAFAGGLLAALQHGSAALAFPAVAVVQAVSDGSLLEALATGALALVGLEAGVDLGEPRRHRRRLGYPAILLASALVGLTRRQYVARSRAAEALVAQTKRTEAASRRAAALDERTRIAREIHDVLAHALGGLDGPARRGRAAAERARRRRRALERIRGCQLTAREGLEEARRAVAALRTDAPPLRESLAALLESHRDQGDRGELTVEGSARELSPEASLALMRTVQEALTNARRHAPGSAVHVRLIYDAQSTSVTVTNDAARAGTGRRRRESHRRLRPGGHARAPGARRWPSRRGTRPGGLDGQRGGSLVSVPLRVLVVDDQQIVREGLATVLDLLADVSVVGSAGDGAEALELVARRRPDVVLLDLHMPVLDGVATTRRIVAEHPTTAVLILTTFGEDDDALEALRAGARGVLTKDAGHEEISRALHQAAAGHMTLAAPLQARLLAAAAAAGAGRGSSSPTVSPRARPTCSA